MTSLKLINCSESRRTVSQSTQGHRRAWPVPCGDDKRTICEPGTVTLRTKISCLEALLVWCHLIKLNVICSLHGLSCTTNLLKNLLPRLVPHIPVRRPVVGGKEVDDGFRQAREAREALVSQMHGDLPEEALHEVHPRACGRREVDVEAGMPPQPLPHRRVLVRGVVVHHEMQLHLARGLPVDLPEELEPLRARVPGVKARDHLAVKVVEGGEQGCRAVPVVVMRRGAYVADPERQPGLGALKRLYLRLLVAAQDDRPLGRREIESDHVPELLLEVRVAGEAEAPGQVRLYPVVAPDAAHGAAGDSRGGGARRLGDGSGLPPGARRERTLPTSVQFLHYQSWITRHNQARAVACQPDEAHGYQHHQHSY